MVGMEARGRRIGRWRGCFRWGNAIIAQVGDVDLWVVKRKTLREFWERYPDAEQPLRAWYAKAASADWDSPARVKEDYPSASIIANDRVVFNIKGNTYRLVVHIRYQHHKIYIRFFGRHVEYDETKVAEV